MPMENVIYGNIHHSREEREKMVQLVECIKEDLPMLLSTHLDRH